MQAEKVKILLGLGGNLPSKLGAAASTIRHAVTLLQKSGIEIVDIASFYETEPVPASGQPNFINTALVARTSFSCEQLLAILKHTEVVLGRKPAERWSARTIDIDLLAYGEGVFPDADAWQAVVEDPDPAAILDEPVVPHPRLHIRGFVLAPLMDIAADWCHPLLKRPVSSLIEDDIVQGQMPQIKKVEEKAVNWL